MFTSHRFATRAVITGGALAIVALATAGTAAAEQTDDQFIAALKRDGLIVYDVQGAIRQGHHICQGLDQGQSPAALSQELVNGATPERPMDATHADAVVVAATAAYCANHSR